MVTQDELLSRAYRLKEDVFGEHHDYMKPTDIHPHIRSWIVSLVLVVWGLFVIDGLFGKALLLAVWLVTQWSFFRSVVKI